MLYYCWKCRKNTKSKKPEVVKTKNGKIMPLSKCVVCNSQNSKFLKKQEARELLSYLMRVKIPILIDLCILNAKILKV